jgi:hypothetical protein
MRTVKAKPRYATRRQLAYNCNSVQHELILTDYVHSVPSLLALVTGICSCHWSAEEILTQAAVVSCVYLTTNT